VEQIIKYVNSSTDELDELVLVVEPMRYPDVFTLTNLSLGDKETPADYLIENGNLRMRLPDPIAPNTVLTLSMTYELNLPAQSGPFGYTDRQVNLTDWYPFIPAYQSGKGWRLYAPTASGEHLVFDSSDFHVDLTTSQSDLVIAAAAPNEGDGNTRRYSLTGARRFVWSASPEYEVLSDQVGEVEIIAYIFPQHRTAGEASLQTTTTALGIFQELFGPTNHKSISLVEIEYDDGLESDGLFFIGEGYFPAYFGNPRNYLTILAAHETSHQWWYSQVGNNQAMEPWVDEALATYCELLYYEHAHPDLLDWWWEFRVNRFTPGGKVDSTIYQVDGDIPYVQAIYLRGAQFLDDLRKLVGDEIFFNFLKDYAIQGANRQMTGDDFFTLLTGHSNADINPLLEEYFTSQ
jgi:hypothetical protein